jgi:hypothetical protein
MGYVCIACPWMKGGSLELDYFLAMLYLHPYRAGMSVVAGFWRERCCRLLRERHSCLVVYACVSAL